MIYSGSWSVRGVEGLIFSPYTTLTRTACICFRGWRQNEETINCGLSHIHTRMLRRYTADGVPSHYIMHAAVKAHSDAAVQYGTAVEIGTVMKASPSPSSRTTSYFESTQARHGASCLTTHSSCFSFYGAFSRYETPVVGCKINVDISCNDVDSTLCTPTELPTRE